MQTSQQAQANAPAQARSGTPAQSQSNATTQSGSSNVPADLGDQISRAVNEAVNAATQAAAAGQNAATRARVDAAMARLRADLARRQLGATPAVAQVPGPFPGDLIPPQAVTISIAFFAMIAFIIVGLPLARAWARRMDRKGQATPVPADLSPRLDRIEQAVDAIAIEVERVSEGQRFTTKVLSELRSLPSPNAVDAWPAGRAPAVPATSGERGR